MQSGFVFARSNASCERPACERKDSEDEDPLHGLILSRTDFAQPSLEEPLLRRVRRERECRPVSLGRPLPLADAAEEVRLRRMKQVIPLELPLESLEPLEPDRRPARHGDRDRMVERDD